MSHVPSASYGEERFMSEKQRSGEGKHIFFQRRTDSFSSLLHQRRSHIYIHVIVLCRKATTMRSFTIIALCAAAASSSSSSGGVLASTPRTAQHPTSTNNNNNRPAFLNKPAMLFASITNGDKSPSRGNRKANANNSKSRGARRGLNENFGLMNGVFDSEYMQRNIQDLFAE